MLNLEDIDFEKVASNLESHEYCHHGDILSGLYKSGYKDFDYKLIGQVGEALVDLGVIQRYGNELRGRQSPIFVCDENDNWHQTGHISEPLDWGPWWSTVPAVVASIVGAVFCARHGEPIGVAICAIAATWMFLFHLITFLNVNDTILRRDER